MDCNQVSRLVYQYADDELAHELRITFTSHLGACPHCGRQARYVRRFLAVVRDHAPRCAAPQDLRDRLLAVLPHRNGGGPAAVR